MNKSNERPSQKLGILHIIISTIAAAFGVQTDRNREKDFKHGNIYTYIISGIVFTVFFVLLVAFIVNTVLTRNGIQ